MGKHSLKQNLLYALFACVCPAVLIIALVSTLFILMSSQQQKQASNITSNNVTGSGNTNKTG